MTRPLRYDDSFTNIINEKIHHKFLNIFNVKVQSTAFSQKLNLQRSLLIVSLWDILFGIIITIAFINNIKEMHENLFFFVENFIIMIGFFFGFVGIDSSTNLRKVNTKVFKNWRIFITFALPFLELINNFSFFCYYMSVCGKLDNLIIVIVLFLINLYWTKIAWSFFIRIEKGHELLIIHGKYLEKMINDESYKLSDVKKYAPPEMLMGATKSISSPAQNNTHATTLQGPESEMSLFTTKNSK